MTFLDHIQLQTIYQFIKTKPVKKTIVCMLSMSLGLFLTQNIFSTFSIILLGGLLIGTRFDHVSMCWFLVFNFLTIIISSLLGTDIITDRLMIVLYYYILFNLIFFLISNTTVYKAWINTLNTIFQNISTSLLYKNYFNINVLGVIFFSVSLVTCSLFSYGYIFALDHVWPVYGFDLSGMTITYLVPFIYNMFIYIIPGWVAEKLIIVLFMLIGSLILSRLLLETHGDE